MSKYLINNADDFGYADDINLAILDSFEKGLLTSASVLMNHLPSTDQSVLKRAKNWPLGLHLNIVTGEPISEKWKTNYETFFQPKRDQRGKFDLDYWKTKMDQYDTEDIFKEFESQIETFLKFFGKLPTHLDTHYNTIMFDNVFSAFTKLAIKFELPVRQPISIRKEVTLKTGETYLDMEKYALVRKLGLKTTDAFCHEYLNRHKNYFEIFEKEVSKLKDGEVLEIVFHPGYQDEWRAVYTKILCDSRLKRYLCDLGVVLVNYSILSSC